MLTTRTIRGWVGAIFLGTAGLTACMAHATVVSDNLAANPGGTESATPARFVTASFTTDASAHTLSSITLLLANTTAGAAVLEIRGDGGAEPGALVGTMTSPATYSASAAFTTFSTSGIALAANSTYWVVLKATSGEFAWSWTSRNTGTGTGFTHTWGVSLDSGAFWWTDDFYQTQMSVVVDACTTPVVSSPASVSNALCGVTAMFNAPATGSGTLSYVWRKDTVAIGSSDPRISGMGGPTLTITGLVKADKGSYDCLVTNSCGSNATSGAATLGMCVADYDCNGSVNVTDIFSFLSAWFGQNLAADMNGDNAISVSDIFAFLSAWFTGC